MWKSLACKNPWMYNAIMGALRDCHAMRSVVLLIQYRLTHQLLMADFFSICLFLLFHSCIDNLKSCISITTFQSRNLMNSLTILLLSSEKNLVLSSWLFCPHIYLQAFFIHCLMEFLVFLLPLENIPLHKVWEKELGNYSYCVIHTDDGCFWIHKINIPRTGLSFTYIYVHLW